MYLKKFVFTTAETAHLATLPLAMKVMNKYILTQKHKGNIQAAAQSIR